MEFRVLGPVEVWDEGRVLPLTGRKQRALVAYLVLHANQVVSRDRLIDELWDSESHDAGRAALRVRIHELRKVLTDDVLQTRAPGYLIRVEPGRLDLHEFERLLEDGRRSLEAGAAGDASRVVGDALALWRGSPLLDVADEPFAQMAIARLEELRLLALEIRLEADLACGRHVEAAVELDGLVAEHPLRESLCRLLMLALYRSGRQVDALDVFRRTRDRLSGELGLEPSASLRDLERDILLHASSLDSRPGGAEPANPVSQRSILIAADHTTDLDRTVEVAESVIGRGSHELIVVRLVAEGAELAAATTRLHGLRVDLEHRGVVVRTAVFTSGRPADDIVRFAAEQDVELVLLASPPALLATGEFEDDVREVLRSAVCDVAIVAGGPASADGPVLVPFGGADHDWAAVELGAWAARSRDVPLVLLGAEGLPEVGKRDASRLLSHASLAVQRALGVTAESILVTRGDAGILEAAEAAGLLVVGLSSDWHARGLGESRLELARSARPPVLLVRKGLRPGGLVPRSGLTRFTWSVRAS